MQAKAVMDDLGYITILIFEQGNYARPLAAVDTNAWVSMVSTVNDQLRNLANQIQKLKDTQDGESASPPS